MATAELTSGMRKASTAVEAALMLFLDGVAYTVKPLEVEIGSAYQLIKRDGTTYNIEDELDPPTCDCGDFTFRRHQLDPEGCKHIKGLRAVGLVREREYYPRRRSGVSRGPQPRRRATGNDLSDADVIAAAGAVG